MISCSGGRKVTCQCTETGQPAAHKTIWGNKATLSYRSAEKKSWICNLMLSRKQFYFTMSQNLLPNRFSRNSFGRDTFEFTLQAPWHPKCSYCHTKKTCLTLTALKTGTLTRQCDDEQRPKHESTLAGAWWEEDLLDTTEPLHELPVQFQSDIEKEIEQVIIRLILPFEKYSLTLHTVFSHWQLTFAEEASALDAGDKFSRLKRH